MLPKAIGNVVTKGFMLFLGLLFLLPPAFKFYAYCGFRFQAVSVDGVVTEGSRGRGLGGRPFVKYEDQQGNTYEIKSEAKTHWLVAPRIGEKLRVFYDQRDPRKAIVNSNFYYIILPLCLIATGLAFLYGVLRDSLAKENRQFD